MAGIAGWVWDLSTGKIAWSENFYQLLGYKASAAELTQTQFLQYIHPDDQKQFKDQLARALEQKMETKFSFRLLRRGNIKHLKASFRILNNGGTDLFICSLQDVTNEHDLQQQLNQQMQLAEALSGNILDRVIITDLNNTIFFWNAACEDVYRLKKPEVLGKNFFDVFQKLKTEQEVVLFNRVLNGERIILKDQKSSLGQGYFDLHMLPLWGDGKKEEVSGIIHIIRDVTKEVELKQNLNDRLRFIEHLVDSSVDRIIAMDRNLNYLVWNKKCVEYYGLQKEEVIGKNVLELFPDTQNTPAFSEFKKVLKGETVYIPPVRESGKEAYHEIYLIPVKNEKDETSAILWILHDLSKEYDLMKEQRRSGEIINALNENYFEIDREYRVLYINPKGEEHFGKSKEELLKKNIWELFPQAVNTPVYHAVKKAMEEREAVRGEFISPTKGTSIFSSMMPTEEGVAVIFFDIHELKAAEEKLQQSKDLLNAVFNASLHGISLFKTIRNKENRIVDFEFALVNDVIRKWYGRDLAGKRYLKESPAIKENGVLEGFAKVIETGAPMVMEVQEGKSWYRMTAVKLGDDLVCTAEDITTRKKEEEELQMTISILSQSEEMAQIGSWDYDIATGAFKWSEGMYRLFGLPQGAIVEPEIYLRFSNPKDRAIAEKIVSCLRNGNCSFEEMMHIQRDGTERLLKIKGTVIHDKKGKPQKVIGIDLDITDAHIAEQKIEESANLLQKMAQASPDSITIYDLVQKAPVYLNHCLANWVDCSLDELLSMGYEGRLSLIHPEDRKKVEAFNQEMLSASDGEIKTVDYRLQSGKGKIIDIRNRSKVFKRNTKGEVTHILSVLTDVTEEVQLKKKLIERTHYVEAIIDNSIDRIMVYDQSYTVIGWNRRSEEHTGVKKERAIGANFFELVPQALHDEEIKGVMQKALEGNYQYIPVKKGIYTHYFYERFYIPLKDAEGNTYAVLNLMHDLSETVKKNEELKELNRTLEQQNKDLEARNEEVTNFAFIASHDLREPLRKISTFSNWLMTEEEKVLSPKGKDYLQRMALAVNRMNAMIDDILVLTRINAESKKEEEVDLNEVLFFVQQDLKKEIAKTKADLIIEKLPSVWGNRNHLVQLFKNLVSNAIKFRVPDRAPEIRITSKFVSGKDAPSANANREKNYVNICIKDNGIGIDLKYAGKLFQVFQRLHGLKEYKGTGMGLAICKKVMEKHNGFITVDGTPGAGSEFCCYFPL
jgi:PAS domain S-box-containing protein